MISQSRKTARGKLQKKLNNREWQEQEYTKSEAGAVVRNGTTGIRKSVKICGSEEQEPGTAEAFRPLYWK